MTTLFKNFILFATVLFGTVVIADENLQALDNKSATESAVLIDLQKKYEQAYAAKNYTKSIALITEIIDLKEKEPTKNAPDLRNARFSLGVSLYQNKQYQRSLELLLQVKQQYEAIEGERLNYARVLHWVALSYQQLEVFDQAKDYYSHSISIKEDILEEDDLELAATYKDFATFSEQTNDQVNTLTYYRKLLFLYQKAGFSDQLSITPLQDKLATYYAGIKNYPEAINLQKKSIKIRTKQLGEAHLETLSSIDLLAHYYQKLGLKKKALNLYQKSLKLKQKQFGAKHKSIAQAYTKIADILRDSRDSNEITRAIEYYKKALAINESAFGKNHPETFKSIQKLAIANKDGGKADVALELLMKNAEAQEKHFGLNNIETASAYQDLASLYDEMGNNEKAVAYYKKASLIQERVLGNSHDSTAKTYNKLGEIHQRLAHYGKAQEYYSKALRSYDAIYGGEHLNTAISFNKLGLLNQQLHNYPKALHYLNKALRIRQNILGEKHLLTAETYRVLADFFSETGDNLVALENYKKCLSIRILTLGKEHLLTAQTNNKMGQAFAALNDNPKALVFYQRALAVNKKALGTQHINVANILNNIGLAHQALGNSQPSIDAFSEAVSIVIDVLGVENQQLADIYSRLSELFIKQENISEALKFSQKSLHIREAHFGLDHLKTASAYMALANVYEQQNAFQKSIKHYQKAINIQQKLLGKAHINTVENYTRLALLYKKTSEIKKYYENSEQAFKRLFDYQKLVFSGLSKPQKIKLLAHIQECFSLLLDATHDVMLSSLKNKNAYLESTINFWINMKGTQFDAENNLVSLYQNTDDKPVKSKIMQLLSSSRSLVDLLNSPPAFSERKPWRNNIAMYKRRIEILNKIISEKVPAFKREQDLVAIDKKQLASQLKKEMLYLDYYKTKEHYYFFTLDNAEKLNLFKIDADATLRINQLIQSFREDNRTLSASKKVSRKKITSLVKTAKKSLANLYSLLVSETLEKIIEDKKALIISPDGALKLLPFATLFDKSNQLYLVEKKEIYYSSNAKNYLRLAQENKEKEEVVKTDKRISVAFIHPNFDLKIKADAVTKKKKKQKDILTSSADTAEIIQSLSSRHFDKIIGIKAKLIKKSLKKKTFIEFSKDRASVKHLLAVEHPELLHISTHSYSLDQHKIINPMLSTGMVFAGANKQLKQSKAGATVTALRLSKLHLNDTRLVILSVSHVDENSAALSQAFIQAGANNIIMTLWQATETKKKKKNKSLMQRFYKRMKKEQSFATTLRESQLAMIKAGDHPYYWSQALFSGATKQ